MRKPELATPAEAITESSWLRDIKPPNTENVAGVCVEQPEQAGYNKYLLKK